MENKRKIGHPLFIISVLTLLINDWFLKITFHNALTGILSDFSGLFAFPFLLSVLFSKHTKKIHIGVALLFIFWKSQYAQTLIDSINQIGIPIHRTIDFSDNIALLSILLSYFVVNDKVEYNIKPILQNALIAVSCFAFMATSLRRYENRKFVDINKTYHFAFSKEELISRLNMVQLKKIQSLNKVKRTTFDSERDVFHFRGQTDTLAYLLDYQKVKNQDTTIVKTSFAEMLILTQKDNNNVSALKLLTVYKCVEIHNNKDYRETAIKEFEKRVIKEISNYR
jgi:general stress protein CsbA